MPTVTNKGRAKKEEAPKSTRLQLMKARLRPIDFGYTVFFTDENGDAIRMYQGATKVEPLQP